MPVYDFHCTKCDLDFEVALRMSESSLPQACPECQEPAKKMVSPVHVIFKGDDWVSKTDRIRRQMKEKDNRLAKRQNERKREGPNVHLRPNVDGEEVSSWSEAQKLAASKGKDTSTYNAMVRKEISQKGK